MRDRIIAKDAVTARRMQIQKTRDTASEVRLRQLLHKAGLRYRIDVRPEISVRRRADIVFRADRIAIFVDGCFWHGCPRHGSWPKNNASWWRSKIEQTKLRDIDTGNQLRASGWTIVRVWEHERPEAACLRILKLVARRRAQL